MKESAVLKFAEQISSQISPGLRWRQTRCLASLGLICSATSRLLIPSLTFSSRSVWESGYLYQSLRASFLVEVQKI